MQIAGVNPIQMEELRLAVSMLIQQTAQTSPPLPPPAPPSSPSAARSHRRTQTSRRCRSCLVPADAARLQVEYKIRQFFPLWSEDRLFRHAVPNGFVKLRSRIC